MLFFCTRRDPDETVSFFYVREETSLDAECQARPRRDRESRYLFLRDRDENLLLMKQSIHSLA